MIFQHAFFLWPDILGTALAEGSSDIKEEKEREDPPPKKRRKSSGSSAVKGKWFISC